MSDSTNTPLDTQPDQTVSFDQLQSRAMDLLRNPAVLAGGAIVLGIVVARLSAGKQLRETAVRKVADLVKGRATETFFPNASIPQPAPQAATDPAPTPPTTAAAPWMAVGKQLLDALAPNLGNELKKRLADILPNTHN